MMKLKKYNTGKFCLIYRPTERYNSAQGLHIKSENSVLGLNWEKNRT